MGCCTSIEAVSSNSCDTIVEKTRIDVSTQSDSNKNDSNKNDLDKIESYIKTDCDYRHSIGSKIDVEKQLKMQRIEIICMGCFISSIKNNSDIEILVRDKFLEGGKYRPDLIYRKGKRIYHVEIDENAHGSYDKEKEEERYGFIKNYCRTNYNSYNLVRFNPNVYGKLQTEFDKRRIAEQFANLLNNIDGLIKYENEK